MLYHLSRHHYPEGQLTILRENSSDRNRGIPWNEVDRLVGECDDCDDQRDAEDLERHRRASAVSIGERLRRLRPHPSELNTGTLIPDNFFFYRVILESLVGN